MIEDFIPSGNPFTFQVATWKAPEEFVWDFL